ncbi:MAG: hypothetical protein RQ847_06400 [Wenzhouxiangellaceae bacterium]|nr:hypothetical protein [Wenzhouxiangellaceae bacterium]
MTRGTEKSRLTLVLLFAVFLAPIVAAVVLHSRWIDWQAAPARAHGELIEPVEPLGAFRADDATGTARSLGDLTGRWQLVLVAGGPCDDACRERLALMRRIRIAQDRHADEVGLVLIAGHELPAPLVDELQRLGPAWLAFDGAAGTRLRRRFPDAGTGAYYIVDPEGNIMERFDLEAKPTGIRKDLDRLLTWTVRE